MTPRYRRSIAICALYCIWTASLSPFPTNATDSSEWEYIQRAEGYRKERNPDAAAIELKNALQRNPDNKDARLLLGKLYVDFKDGAAAEDQLRRAIERGIPADDAAVPLAQALLLQGKFRELLDEVTARESLPTNRRAAIHSLRGEAFSASKQHEAAAEEFQAALTLEPTNQRALLGQARMLISEELLNQAQQAIKEALDANPQLAPAWSLLGDVESQRGDISAAEASYSRAIEYAVIPDFDRVKRALLRTEIGNYEGAKQDIEAAQQSARATLDVTYAQGLLDFRQERFQKAQERFQRVLRNRPDHVNSLYFCGASHFGLGNYEQAEEYLSRVLTRLPSSADAALLLGLSRLHRGDAARAEQVLRQALESKADDPRVLGALAKAVRAQGRQVEADDYLRLAVEYGSESSTDWLQLAIANLQTGDLDRGMEQLRHTKDLYPDQMAADAAIIQKFLQRGETTTAIELAGKLLAERPGDANALALAGIAHFVAKEEQEAMALLKQALEIAPGLPNAALNLAKIATRDGNTDKARGYLGQVLDHNPGHQRALIQLASLEAGQGDPKAARRHLNQAAEENPNALEPRLALARLALGEGDALAALAALRSVAPRHGDNPLVVTAMGEALVANGEAGGAAREFEKLTRLQPESAEARYLLGIARLRKDDKGGAREALLEGLRLDPSPNNLPSSRLMTDLVSATENLADKIAIVDELKSVQPEHPQVLDLEAQLAARQGDTARPIEIYRGLTERFPAERVWMHRLAKAQRRTGDTVAYLDTLNGWIAEHPEDWLVHAMLANGYLYLDRLDDAKAALEKSLALAPAHTPSLNNLAWLLRKEDPERALELAQKAHELRPEEFSIQDTLGTILLLQGRHQDAFPLLKDAAAKSPTNATIQYHYALVREKTGDRRGALRTLKAALAKDPDFPEKPEAAAMLSRLESDPD